MPGSSTPRIVVIGASAGGVMALQVLAAAMPRGFPLPIVLVLHIGKRPSIFPDILGKAGPLTASHARHGEALRPGHFHVAPPDHHVLVRDGSVHLSLGPKEHHARPAIDPLFRSAALDFHGGAIGVVMTGFGEDGTSGLQAIKSCGGAALVQDPETAEHSGMPASALRYAEVDRSLPVPGLAQAIAALSNTAPKGSGQCPDWLRHEQELFLSRGTPLKHLEAIGEPSPYVCPDCKGGLWMISDSRPVRYRCHTGHAFTLRSLQHAQSEGNDSALWGAIRGLQEETMLLRDMARMSHGEGDHAEAARLEAAAERISMQAGRLRELVERMPDDVARDSSPRQAAD
jgi:two-component system chemotaxis response regulator CheB